MWPMAGPGIVVAKAIFCFLCGWQQARIAAENRHEGWNARGLQLIRCIMHAHVDIKINYISTALQVCYAQRFARKVNLSLLLLFLSRMAGRTSTSYEFIFGIMYAVIGLGLGGTVQVVLKSYCPQLPYTVIIFFLGLGISLAIEFWNAAQSDNISTEATSLLDSPKIGSDVIIYVFLPILIFGECMNLNWHHVLSGLSQSILLAGPGAVVGCVLMGLMSKAFLPWMSWNVAFMFG